MLTKQNLSILLVVIATTWSAAAALILHESFAYPDGPLITVSGGAWTTHSGTTPGQIEVQNAKVILTTSETEDVNTLLPNGPCTNGTLYASFVLNATSRPSAGGAYFAHFKDAGAGYRSRVFLATTNAAAGCFRLGFNMGNNPVFIPADLNTNTDYLVVIKQEFGPQYPSGTLWINPTDELDTTRRVDVPADATIANVPAFAFALRQDSGMGTVRLSNLKVATTFADAVYLNPPALSFIADQRLPANGSTGPIPIIVSDVETTAGSLTLSAVSDNQTLAPTANIVFGGSGANRTVTITPAPGVQGQTLITVTVQDADGHTASRTFSLAVGVPTLSSIPEQITRMNQSLGPLAFSVYDTESASGNLVVTAISTNQSLVNESGIALGGSGSNRTVTITPVPDQAGLTQIILSVSDGFSVVSNRFLLTIAPERGLELTDDFNYADGPVVPNSAYFWAHTSGSNDEMQVTSGKLQITASQSEDVSAFLANAPYAPGSGYVLYCKFEVTFSTLPTTTTGEYFAHFKDSGSGYRARIFATTNGATLGAYRLGIANSGARPSAVFPLDLHSNTAYTVVTRYNLNTTQSALWLNPASESDPAAIAADPASLAQVYGYAFRQNTGEGGLLVDVLRVGTAFSDVVSLPVKLRATSAGKSLILDWPVAEGYVLESTASLTAANWHSVGVPALINGRNCLTNGMSGPSGFFRLRK